MLIISSREFKEKQKKYLDLVDKNEQVIVRRGKHKAYTLMPVSLSDRYFADPVVKDRIKLSLSQLENEELITVKKEEIDKFLGL